MKRLFNLMLAVLLMVMLSACGKQDSSADKESEQYEQTESAETVGQAGQEQSAASETTQTEVQTENLQKGVVVIPGSSNPDHIQENTKLFDFELTEEEMERINALDRGEKHDWY